MRTGRWKLPRHTDRAGLDELDDLHHDPYEMKNLNGDPRAAGDVQRMRDELARQLQATGGPPR